MSLPVGTRLGRYEIIALLGAGGMGEVYRARDESLRRDVAVKVLLEEFSGDPARVKRLEREALATAALNHPNIVSTYDVGSLGAATFIVSELLEGRTLRDVLTQGEMPPRRALRIAAQIAEGLAAAHAKGIVHRDVKPANVFVTADDRIKILDFGLARIQHEAADAVEATTTTSLTTPGTVLGSAGYMAPEQVRGGVVDHRADIFSLGVVLYEMLAGRRAFHRDTVAGTLGAIVESDPPSWQGDGSAIAQSAMRTVKRCLEKSPNDRFQSARDLSLVLADAGSDAVAPPPPATRASRGNWGVVAAAAIVGVVAGGFAWSRVAPPATVAAPVAFQIPVTGTDRWGPALHPAISPDGSTIAFAMIHENSTDLYVRRLDDPAPKRLVGTREGTQPFFSPDGRELAFFADQQLKAIAVAGGPPRVICDVANLRGAAWGDDGNIVLAAGVQTGLSRVPATGGVPQPMTTLAPGETSHRFPFALPGGGVVFVVQRSDGLSSVAGLAKGGRQPVSIVKGGSAPQFARGRLSYVNDRHEWTTAMFDPAALTLTGPPEAQAERATSGAYVDDSGLSLSRDGSIVYLPFEPEMRVLEIVSRDGHVVPLALPQRPYGAPQVSRDGLRVAVGVAGLDGSTGDVWMGDISGALAPITRDGHNRFPQWSPTGDRLAYSSQRPGSVGLGVLTVDRPGDPMIVGKGYAEVLPASWAPDDTILIGNSSIRPGFQSMTVLKLGQAEQTLVPVKVAKTVFGRLSPDGTWLAYTSYDSAQWELYLTRYPLGGRVWAITGASSGQQPTWAKSGKELFFSRADKTLWCLNVGADGPGPGEFRQVKLDGRTIEGIGAGAPDYDTMPDGRFLFNRTVANLQSIRPLVVVVNRIPAGK